jgi:hypothetical protein
MSGIYPAYFSDEEPIASLWNCLNEAGIVRVIVQRLPELANRHPETAVKIDERMVRPEAASKFVPANYLSGVLKERDQEPVGLLLELYAPAVLEQFPGGGVYLKWAELVDSSGLCLHTGLPKSTNISVGVRVYHSGQTVNGPPYLPETYEFIR